MCRSSMKYPALALTFLASCMFPILPRALAQSTTNGAIAGTVKDAQGLAVPDASVTVRSAGTGKQEQTKTDDVGAPHERTTLVEFCPGHAGSSS